MAKDMAKWDPFREMTSLRDDMDRFFESFFGRYPKERIEGFWAPSLDIAEDKDGFSVKVELPGMKKEDIKISIAGDTLAISGERRHEFEEKGRTYHRIERAYGQFKRTVTLPTEVETSRTKASYEDGILTLSLPKSERAKAKEIAIEVK